MKLKTIDKPYYRKMGTIAVPSILQDLLVNSLTFVDTLMIGRLGTEAIAAVGLANQLSFLINLFFFGIFSGCSIFIAQFYGAGNKKGIQNIMGLATTVSVVGAAIFCFLAMVTPSAVMHLFTQDAEVTAIGASYLKIIGPSFFFLGVSKIFSAGMRGTGLPAIPLQASLLSMAVNIVLNYLLIFGIGIFPVMGVRGAALATSISRFAELLYVLINAYKRKSPSAITERSAFHFTRSFLHTVVPTCIPVLCNEFFWALGMMMYKVAYAKLGTETIAAINVSESISNMFFTVMFGVASSSLIVIGQKIGEKRMDEARTYCKRSLILAVIAGVVMGSLQAIFSKQLVTVFSVEGSVALMAQYCLYSRSLLCPLTSFDTTLIVGILRSGGDTRFSMLAELLSVWLIGIPMAFLGCLYLHWDIWFIFLLVGLEEVVKGIAGLLRVRSGKWLKDLSATR